MIPDTRSREEAVSSAMVRPLSTFWRAWEIREEVLWEALAVLAASRRTSSATTAKPLPASPARAASTAAFSARMLVWKAMSSMFLMMPRMAADWVLM